MSNEPVYGCAGCSGTAGAWGCPTHGNHTFTIPGTRARPTLAPSPSVTEPDYADEASEYCGSCPHQKIAHGWRRRPEAIPAGRCLSGDCPCDGFTPSPSVTEPETPAAPRTEARPPRWARGRGQAILAIEAEAAALAARPAEALEHLRDVHTVTIPDENGCYYCHLASLPTEPRTSDA